MRIDYPRAGKRRLRRFIPSWRQLLSLTVLFVAVIVGGFFVLLSRTTVPSPNQIASAQSSVVYWDDGKTVIGTIGAANRVSIPLAQVPLITQRAVLAAEDRGFYDHGGFSVTGIARAAYNNLTGGGVEGGSTITQQYTKNAFLTQQRTWSRKLEELLISVKLETQISKDQILEDYLNTIYWGRGSYGIETASKAYFGIEPSQLTLGQSAALAAIINSPAGFSPTTHIDKLKARWKYVMDGLLSQGWITPAQAKSTPFPTKDFIKYTPGGGMSGTNGYLLAAVRSELSKQGLSEDQIAAGGLKITTTFNLKAQTNAVAAVVNIIPTKNSSGLRVGLVAIEPTTGEVKAMYGGANYATNQVNNATQAIGQAGSTFKAFALAAATEKGVSLDSYWDGNNDVMIDNYRVVNEGDQSWGQISLLTATEQSVNSVYVAVSKQIGYDSVIDAAERAGIPATTPALNPLVKTTVALGTSSPHVIDMASAYATFANQGNAVTPTVLQTVVGANDGILYQAPHTQRQEFTPEVANTVNYALQRVVTSGTGYAAQDLGRPAAGKTGTTNGNLSAWFVGYTPQLATAVMLVRDGKNGQPISLSGLGGGGSVAGGSYPARVWTAFMKGALQGTPVVDFPSNTTIPTPPPPSPTPSTPSLPPPTPTPSATPTPTPSETKPTSTPTPTGPPTPTATPTPTPTVTKPAAGGGADIPVLPQTG